MKKDSPFISTLSNLVSSYFTMALGILIGILVTRSLGPELRGEYGNIKLIVTFYSTFLLFGYHGGVLFFGVNKSLNLKDFFWTGSVVTILLSVICIVALYFLIELGALGKIIQEVEPSTLILGLLIVPFIFFNAYSERIIRSYSLFRIINKRMVISVIVTLIYYLYYYLFSQIDLFVSVMGMLLGQLTNTLLNLYFILTKIKVHHKLIGALAFKPFSYGWKNWINQILNTSNDKIDQLIISFILSLKSFGLYLVGVSVCNLLSTVTSSYVNVFFNQIAEQKGNGIELYQRAQRVTTIVTTMTVLFLMALGYPLILLFYGQPFSEAFYVVLFYSPGMIFQVLARMTIKFYSANGKPLKNSLIYLVGILVGLPFYFLLIPELGIIGAAIASTITYFAGFVFSFYQIRKEFKIGIGSLVPKFEDFNYLFHQVKKMINVILGKLKLVRV